VREHGPDDLRDHVTRALDDDGVADADVLAVDVVLVVEGRVRDGHASDLDGLELRPRVECAGPSHSDTDLQELRLGGHRRPLVRAGPSRATVELAQAPLLVVGIDLDHDPVDLVVELDALRLPDAADLGDGCDRLVPFGERVRAEAVLAEPLECLPVCVDPERVRIAEPVHPDRERT
jgi:hypothetical protein